MLVFRSRHVPACYLLNPVECCGSIVLVDCAVNRQVGLLSGDLKLGVRERLCDCLRKMSYEIIRR